MSSLADSTLTGLPLLGPMVMLVIGERLWAARRREALNRALHELRRPLQMLALSQAPPVAGSSPLELALAALAQLDREINGGSGEAPRVVSCRELVGGAVGRWRARAAIAGGSIVMRWFA
jgi:hypothetical protein